MQLSLNTFISFIKQRFPAFIKLYSLVVKYLVMACRCYLLRVYRIGNKQEPVGVERIHS